MIPTGRLVQAMTLLLLALATAGCSSPTIVVLEDPRSYVEERSMATARKDARIKLDIQALYIDQKNGKLKNVTVEVYERAVLLVGATPDQAAKSSAGALATSVDGVAEVINEIQIQDDPGKRDAAADLSIETKVKKALRDTKGINQSNLRWHSVNGVVYMFGRALSVEERDAALAIVGKTEGVTTVVDHIMIAPPAK